MGAHACGTDERSLAGSGLGRILFRIRFISAECRQISKIEDSRLNSSVLATGASQNRGDVCFPGGVKVLLLGNSAHCLMPSVESHSSGQQMLADCPLEAAPEPDRISHISTSFHHPLFSLRPLCQLSFVLLSKG